MGERRFRHRTADGVLGLLGLSMPPVEAATLIVIPTLATNAWQFMSGPEPLAVTTRFAILLVGVAIGTAFGVGFLTGSHTALVSLALGGVLILYARGRLTLDSSAHAGACGTMGVAADRLRYWHHQRRNQRLRHAARSVPDVDRYAARGVIQSIESGLIVAMLALAVCLAWTGHVRITSAGASTLALLPVFVGMYAGQLVRVRLHADAYREWFFIGLIGLGASSVIRALLMVGELQRSG